MSKRAASVTGVWIVAVVVVGIAGCIVLPGPGGGGLGGGGNGGGEGESSGGEGEGQPPAGEGEGEAPPPSDHGKVCRDPSDCGGNTICVVENAGDQQGVCRVVCSGVQDCLGNPEVTAPFDTSCCDVSGGTRVCADAVDYPNADCT